MTMLMGPSAHPPTRACAGCRFNAVYKHTIDWNTIAIGQTPVIACSRECAELIEKTRDMPPLERELARIKVCTTHHRRAAFDAAHPELMLAGRLQTVIQSRGQLRQLVNSMPEGKRGEARRRVAASLEACDQPPLEE